MKALVEHGWAELVVKKYVDPKDPPSRRLFAITEAGRRVLFHHRSRPHPRRKKRS
jgi:DNA-binding PadR family transcriptional regulator